MNPAFKNRTSDEALDEHMKQLKAAMANRRHNNKFQSQVSQSVETPEPPSLSALAPTPPPPPPPTMTSQRHHPNVAEPMRVRSDSSATSIYVMGNNTPSVNDDYSSNPPTIDRKQEHRLSWVNMRRRADGGMVVGAQMGLDNRPPITPSPQTTRSYISNITTTEIISSADGRSTAGLRDPSVSGGGGGGGTISGRTTATSGHISSSGVTTICGSNNTLNEIHSDYHSQDVGGSRDFHNFSRIGASPMKQNMSVDGSFNLANGSTVKLISGAEDEKNQQVSQ